MDLDFTKRKMLCDSDIATVADMHLHGQLTAEDIHAQLFNIVQDYNIGIEYITKTFNKMMDNNI